MNRALLPLLLSIMFFSAGAQNFHGQWKGYFIDKSASALSFGSDRSDYVLDLDVDDSMVSGYSYTYFTDGGHRYYTICRLTGTANKKTNRIQITETERTKTNVPDNISNSFQIHTLSWRKDGDNEILEGNWRPAPGQGINTGYGVTYLAKRQLTEISPLAKKVNAKKDPANTPPQNNIARTAKPVIKKTPATVIAKANTPVKRTAPVAVKKPTVTAVAKATIKPPVKKPVTAPVAKAEPLKTITAAVPKDTVQKTQLTTTVKSLNPFEKLNFEKRDNTLLQTVLVGNTSVKVDLYDSGDVDGDSVSLFYNGKVLLAHKMLSEKAITLTIPVKDDDINELVMYADNLGTIPPNTALMIVYDGTKRYEVRITSDLKQSGTIRFIHNSSAGSKP